MSSSQRRYTEEQMALILRRASELQASRESGTLSLRQIQSIAQEVGIDAGIVAEVAQTVSPDRRAVPVRVAGMTRSVEMVLPKADDTGLGAMIDAVRRASGTNGTAQTVLNGVEWRWGSENEVEDLRVSLTPASEGTRVRISYDATGAHALAWIAGVAPGLIGSALALKFVPGGAGIAASAAAVGATIAGIRWFVHRLRRRGERLTADVARALQEESQRALEQGARDRG